MIVKFRNKGVKIEKTKSRLEVFKKLFQMDPSLLALPARSSSNSLNYMKNTK
ncbi:Lmo0850 family protein [Peribacillus kribbensis]|uniref:Lmo0850 family protein n=1 Tax=Peribacillus kribbensis TaxID=356658 RepID=UPI003CCBD9A9